VEKSGVLQHKAAMSETRNDRG